ncbi:hypothetical protein LCGC14_0744320 [marine sediment metagenome]|uniref:Plasmid related protein n=1 Tax=marine sediment metagenome TaxID=412755 RepID=A0A0F9QQU8_9ZZZZ
MALALGRTVMTRGVSDLAVDDPSGNFRAVLGDLLRRHASGDWGDLSPDDRKANEEALKNGDRLLSAYHLLSGVKLWVITEADRSSTCILLPDEY